MANAICIELADRSGYLKEEVQTIYFGGGTPSILEHFQISNILKTIQENYRVCTHPEITFEVNPEDLDLSMASSLIELGISRLSMGFQTFNNSKLRWMNRAHTAEKAREAYGNARQAGFKNISIDLIYALPHEDQSLWEFDLENVLSMAPEHISLYGLTIEERTVFGKKKRNGALTELDEDRAAQQYLYSIEKMEKHGYSHYEVSNFCKHGYHSRHNHSYWSGSQYLGVGPGAHSFDGHSRQANIRNNAKYMYAIEEKRTYFETELLSDIQLLNERILTGLRTASGISILEIYTRFGVRMDGVYCDLLNDFERRGLVNTTKETICLTTEGFLVADDIALELFFQE